MKLTVEFGPGLGTFRRQLSTVDSPDIQEPTTPLLDPDEDYDDIDKVRDDLQSTKQLLEIEMKNRAKSEAENVKLTDEIRKLKAEMVKKPAGASLAASASSASLASSTASASFGNHNVTATPFGHTQKSSSRVMPSHDKSKSISRIG